MLCYRAVILKGILNIQFKGRAVRSGLMILFLFMDSMILFAQVFQTQTGTIQASGKFQGTSTIALSHEFKMHLNYELAEIHLQLALASLTSENDLVQEKLQDYQDQEFIFKGKMNISFIPTKSHPKQSFTTEGILQLNGVSRPFSFNAVLEHIPIGSVSCVLSGEFIIHLDEFNVVNLPPGEENVSVTFNQLVLRRSGEKY